MDSDAVLGKLESLVAAPDPLEVVAEALTQAGAWRSWTIERQLWYLRQRRGWTQAELARRAGVSQRRISRIEAGEDALMSTIRSLYRAMGHEPLLIPDTIDWPRYMRPRRKMTQTTSLPSQ